jgi:uncharacterized phage protein gp47/JayE
VELTATGLVIDTVDEIVDAVSASLKNKISANLDTNPETSVVGQLIGIFAERERQIQEVVREIYNSGHPAGATGQALAQLALITGTIKADATRSTVVATVGLNAGVTLPVGARANVAGAPDVQFETVEDVINPGGTPGDFEVTMRAVEVGPVRANAGTLTEITTPVVGWTDVDNDADAELGRSDETDPELRARREAELRRQGSASLDAIATDVEDVDGIVSVAARENTSGVAVDGLPAKSFQIVVWDTATPDADDDAIAQAIWDSKPAGMLSFGADSGEAVDRTGATQVVNFTRAEQVEMYLEIDIMIDPDTFPVGGDDLIKESVVSDTETRWTVGADVVPSALYGSVFTRKIINDDGSVTLTPIPGVIGVSAIRQGVAPSPVDTTNRTIDFDQIALLSTARVDVNHV